MQRWILGVSLVFGLALSAGPARADPLPERSWSVPTLHAVGLLAVQRAAAMVIWPEGFSLERPARTRDFLRRAYREPPRFEPDRPFFAWDGDHWFINLVGHGLMGSEVYLRTRSCGHGAGVALLFATATSVAWEYGVEVWNSRPSLNDLIWTPLGGALIGEARRALWGAAAGLPSGLRATVRALVDPFGELERALGTPC